jgi:hypothetical protein
MYYAWRDQFLSNMSQAFEIKMVNQKGVCQAQQIDKMKKIIVDLTIELKKTMRICGNFKATQPRGYLEKWWYSQSNKYH